MWTATGSRKISVKDMIWIRFKQEHHKWKWAPRALVFQEILRNLFREALLSQNRWIRLFLEGKIIANLWGPVDVCAFWHRFTVKYSLNIKDNLQYKCLIREWPQAVFFLIFLAMHDSLWGVFVPLHFVNTIFSYSSKTMVLRTIVPSTIHSFFNG